MKMVMKSEASSQGQVDDSFVFLLYSHGDVRIQRR